MNENKLPELLSPAGDPQSLAAAVYAGADAVYLGTKQYNARAYAGNFDEEELQAAARFCRLYGVKIYLTFNTIVHQREFDSVLSYAEEVCRNVRPDGVIVQSPGFAKRLHERTGVPIVASTQMAQHNSLGAKLLRDIGVCKIVAARELSLENAASIQRESGLDVEIFVHGAICVSQSGGCLMSSMIGKRSGNQGKCAQPCRLSYNGKYPLSLKDMCLAEHITEIIDAQISSLKIEGRMKSPAYVYGVTSVYRKLLDERRNATAEEIAYLEALFSRNGFTDGYFRGKLGVDMFGVRTEGDKENTRALKATVAERRIPVKLFAKVSSDECTLNLESGGKSVTVEGALPQKAQKAALTEEELSERISKLGGTCFVCEDVRCVVGDDLFLPVSVINDMRRRGVSALENAMIEANTPSYRPPKPTQPSEEIPTNKALKTSILVYNLRFYGKNIPPCTELLKSLKTVDDIGFFDIPLHRKKELYDYLDICPERVRAILPRCIFPQDVHNISKELSAAKERGLRAVLCSGFAAAPLAEQYKMEKYADFTANACDGETLKLYKNEGFLGVCASPEMKSGSVRELSDIIPSGLIAYGRLPLMHTSCCIVESASGKKCPRNKNAVCQTELTDRTGAKFPVIREYGHSNLIFNSVPLYLLDKKDELISAGVKWAELIFTDEDGDTVTDTVFAARRGDAAKGKITRGYF